MTEPARILIVEDEAIVSMDLQRRVEQLGYQVVGTAASGKAAIERSEQLRPDLALMDIRLQGDMDGVTAAEHIRRTRDVPVVFLTAFSDPVTVQRATASEPFGYVLKPVDDRELEIAIAVALDRHQADRRIRSMERWLSTTLTSIADAVITTDLDGRVTFMNTVAQSLTGWRAEDGRGRPLEEVLTLVDEEDQSRVVNPVARVLAGRGEERPTRRTLIRPSGGRVPVEDSAAPIRDDDGVTGVVVVLRDVTAQRTMAEALRQSQKLEAVGRLAGGVAHEFNNLMTVVLMTTEFVLDDGRLPGSLRDAMLDIRRAGERAVEFTRQLLTFGRKQTFRPQIIDLNVVVRETAQMLGSVLGDRVRLQIDLAESDALLIKADRAQLEQMFVNLAANGRDAMPSGGTLTIATRREGATVLCEVSDTGVGMTRDVMDHLFEPFFTTKGVGVGTGLGLAAVHGAVALADGRIDVQSAPGAGTSFRIRFPASGAGLDASTAEPHVAPSIKGGGKTVLVVDDEASVRHVVGRVLRRAGFVVLEADDTPEALTVMREHEGDVDLVITDVVMPSGSGADLARRIVATRPGIKTLLMSGYPERNLAPLDSGGLEAVYLQKPFAPAALLARVRELLFPEEPS